MNKVRDIIALTAAIRQVHTELQSAAVHAVNKALTIRNWLIGYYIVEYEQNGADRAEYGINLMDTVAKHISIKGLTSPELSRCRQFYQTYTYILGTASQELRNLNLLNILGTLTHEFKKNSSTENRDLTENRIPISGNEWIVPSEQIVNKLSFSHFVELIKIPDPLKRGFYEIECIKGTWTVRELKRQIASLYFERIGLSQNPEKLAKLVHQKIQPQVPKDIIKNIYSFEFLDLGIQALVEESDLETALLNHLQHFILELGNGFCLEARQKRILIGVTYYFIDLVFYHRILKCHVLIELKIGSFEHQDIGQLNTYINFYHEEMVEPNDNPPVGILLVAEKDHALVKYATAGMDENLFVQQYLLRLPNLDHLKAYIENELRNLNP